MTAVEALLAARAAGIQISIEGDDLVLESTAEPPVAVVDLLTEHKANILTILRSGEAALSSEDWEACCDKRAAIAERGVSTDTTHGASRDITGSASTDIISSATTNMISCTSGAITGATDITGSAAAVVAATADASTLLAASARGGISASSGTTGSSNIVTLRRPKSGVWSPNDWLGFYDEKAGIAEYDHGLPRPEAEARAFDCCVAEWLYRNAVVSPPGPCPICGETDRPNDDLLPVGLGGGEVWLHVACSAAWRAARIAEAVAALGAMGIGRPDDNPT